MRSERLFEVCPVCGSRDLYYEMGGYTGKVYHCKSCDYVGSLVVEADAEMIEAISMEYKRQQSGSQVGESGANPAANP